MVRYVLRRLLLAVPVLLGVSLGVFLMVSFIPGDPATVIAGDTASAEQVARIRHELGLDESLPVQYLRFLERIAHGSLGESTRTHREVLLEIADRFPYTLALALGAVALSTVAGITMGIFAAVNRGRMADHLTMGIAIVGLSVPTFWIALIGIIVFSLNLHWLPVTGARSPASYILPIVALSLHSAAVKARITRSSMLEVFGQDYLRTARAKGLRERLVIFRHALKNALIPISTIVGLQFGSLLGGAFIIETIFGWPGIGRLAVQAVFNRDFPLIQGTVLVGAVTYALVNLLVDLLYAWLDPRIRYS
ncbi:MAG TPA: ABC transporter permease [Candidatus Limnocylindria bacterium]|jgi:peptide/nickel transport system permease protein/oligopeptide transport system permease protein|nr:ABC transporter permease [Candidatus Limnocylindria bacterium]